MKKKDFKLLLSFLTDKSEKTRHLAKNQLKMALKQHPQFQATIKDISDEQVRDCAALFFEEIRYDNIEREFSELAQQGTKLDLEKGTYLLAKLEYPSLNMSDISKPLDDMAKGVDRLFVKEKPLPTRAISAMRDYLFNKVKLRGDENNYYDPKNLFLNNVLRTKKGIPISLSCIYLFVAWRLKLSVHGVGLPGHFVVGHRVPRGVVYIDSFQSGKILRMKDCEVLVKRLGLPFRHSYLDPTENSQVLARMIVNLINIYNDKGNTHRAHFLAKLFQMLR